MNTLGKYLHLRLVVEGIEVPCIAAVVSAGLDASASASIEVIPTDRVLRLLPRSLIHCFFYDFVNGQMDPRTGFPTDESYKLLFSGELVGVALMRSPAGRSAVLQCSDVSLYLDTCYQLMIDYGPNGNFVLGNVADFVGAHQNLFDSLGVGNDPITVVAHLLNSKPVSPQFLNIRAGLLAGLIRVIEEVGGVPSKFHGANDFFTVGAQRVRLLDQIAAAENDRSPGRIMSAIAFNKLLRNELGGGGGLFSVRDILLMVMSHIFYHMVPNPTAYMASAQTLSRTDKVLADKSSYPIYARIQEALTAIKRCLARLRSSPNRKGTVKEFSTNALAGPSNSTTRPLEIVPAMEVGEIGGDGQYVESLLKESLTLCLAKPELSFVVKDLLGAQKQVQELIAFLGWDGREFLLKELTPAQISSRLTALAQALSLAVKRFKWTEVKKTTQSGQRLQTQLFLPDLWFATPPSCNIIFPDQNTQFTYQRSFLREVTRLQVSAGLFLGAEVIRDPLINSYYYAPAIDSFKKIASGRRFMVCTTKIMDHEKHTGIIPKMDGLGEISKYFGDNKKSAVNRIGYIQRVASYNFFRYRYAPRSLSFSAGFHPFLIVGLPAVLLSRPNHMPVVLRPGNSLAPVAVAEAINHVVDGGQLHNPPVHIVGKLVAFQHTVNQQGGVTNGTLQYAREHSGDDDQLINKLKAAYAPQLALGDNVVTVLLNMKRLLDANDVRGLALLAAVTPQRRWLAGDPPTPDNAGSLSKPVIRVGDLDPITGREIKDIRYLSGDRKVKYDVAITKPNTINVSAADLPGLESLKEIAVTGDGADVFTLQTHFDIAEEAALDEVAPVAGVALSRIPFEELVRPAFIDEEIYSRSKIGPELYQPLFGCNALVDLPLASLPTGNLPLTGVHLTMEQALDIIAIIYGQIREEGMDAATFAYQFTYRPIATLREVLGTPDLEYTVVGKEATVTKGVEGFHSRAISPALRDLAGLQLGVAPSKRKGEEISGSVDPRPEKRERAREYRDELAGERGLIG